MSKNKQSIVAKQIADQSKRKKMTWAISVISIVTVIALTITMIFAFYTAPTKTLINNTNEDIPTSADTIKNGDFAFISEQNVSFPKTATDWNIKSYNSTSSFNSFTDLEKSTLGILDISADGWKQTKADLENRGIIGLVNPGKVVDSDKDNNVFMIHNKEMAATGIYSASFTISANTYTKISFSIKTVDVSDNGASVMVKKGGVSPSAGTSTPYFFTYDHNINTNGAWKNIEFYIYNGSTSSQSTYVSVSLGNIYTGKTSTGTLFVDDILFTSSTASDYNTATIAKIGSDQSVYFYEVPVKNEKDEYVTLGLDNEGTTTSIENSAYASAKELYRNEGKTPFANETQKIFVIDNSNATTAQFGRFFITNPITVHSPTTSNALNIHFWMRTVVYNNDATALAKIDVITHDQNGIEVSLGSFTKQTTDADVTTTTYNGWTLYNIFVKPSNAGDTEIQVKISFGNKVPAESPSGNVAPQGLLLISGVESQMVDSGEYTSASTGNNSKKIDLSINNTATTTVTNGSFSNLGTNADTQFPAIVNNWNFVHAGDVLINKDGKNNVTVPNNSIDTTHGLVSRNADNSVLSGLGLTNNDFPVHDDITRGILLLKNNANTSSGYLSSPITLSANTYYLISVQAKGLNGAIPYIYLIDDVKLSTKGDAVKAQDFLLATDGEKDANGYVRYYFVVAIGDYAKSVRIALFNGEIDASVDGTTSKGTQVGTVLFDKADFQSFGTYTRGTSEETLHDIKDADGAKINYYGIVDGKLTLTKDISFDNLIKHNIADTSADNKETKYSNVTFLDLRNAKDEVKPIPEDKEEEPTPTPAEPVDLALLFSILASALMVIALIIVIIVKIVKRKKTR